MIKKSLIFAVLATFCLTMVLFTVIPVGSYGTYDPWMDLNDDGKITAPDIAAPCAAYGSTGDPTKNVNVTNWPGQLVAYPMRNPTQISLEQEFNWTVGEIVDVQRNLYVYQGYTQTAANVLPELLIAEWQNGWIALTYQETFYYYGYKPFNVSLSPYLLEVAWPSSLFFTATFHGN